MDSSLAASPQQMTSDMGMPRSSASLVTPVPLVTPAGMNSRKRPDEKVVSTPSNSSAGMSRTIWRRRAMSGWLKMILATGVSRRKSMLADGRSSKSMRRLM